MLVYILIFLLLGHFMFDFCRKCCSPQSSFPFVSIDSKLVKRWITPKAYALLYIGVPIYCIFAFLLWYIQDHLIYPGAFVSIPMEDLNRLAQSEGLVPVQDTKGNTIGYQLGTSSVKAARGTVIVVHGNGAFAIDRTAYIDALEPRGFHVILYEYPGYGGRPGPPNATQIVAEVSDLVRRVDAAGRGPVYLWGESLGTGVAGQAAADPSLPIKGLVLITPFNSLSSLSWSMYPIFPVPLMIRDHYDTEDNLAHFAHPVVVIQSEKDELVPAWSSGRLFSLLPSPKKHILQPNCGHSNWPSAPELVWWTDAADFIAPK